MMEAEQSVNISKQEDTPIRENHLYPIIPLTGIHPYYSAIIVYDI